MLTWRGGGRKRREVEGLTSRKVKEKSGSLLGEQAPLNFPTSLGTFLGLHPGLFFLRPWSLKRPRALSKVRETGCICPAPDTPTHSIPRAGLGHQPQ